MNRFSSSRPGSMLDQQPLYQSSTASASTSASTSTTTSTPPSVFDEWSDSSSSSPEAMMPYHQPWASEPTAMNNCSLPMEPPSNGLPRIIPPMGCHPVPEWSDPLLGSSYSTSSRPLRPEMRRLPSGKHMPDNWMQQAKSEAASLSLYKASHPHPLSHHHHYHNHQHHQHQHHHHHPGALLPPHSSYSSTNPTTTTSLSPSTSTAPSGMPYHHALPLSVVSPPIKLEINRDSVTVAPPPPPKHTQPASISIGIDEADDANADPPYSQLIYEALLTAPGKKLPLQGIYHWFEENTAKGRDRGSKGWQNSIRHNLSMNAGFEAIREETTPGKKPINYWRLTDEAVNNGIQSTTRYRKTANYKRPTTAATASDPPAPQRQRSGAKGGKATKVTSRFRGVNGLPFGPGPGSGPGSASASGGMGVNMMGLNMGMGNMGMMNYMGYSSPSSSSSEEYRRERERAYRAHYQPFQNSNNNPQPHSQSTRQHQHPHGLPSSKHFAYNNPHASTHRTPSTTAPTPTTATGTGAGGYAVGADAAPAAPVFCDMAGPGPDCLVFDAGFMGMDGVHSIGHSPFGGSPAAEMSVGL
ncbi:forkhead box transcription factor [Aspergillus stella-maris]|uniref:forkhead box transcription factor n=1 Tax=Aspergillus stella-maris TaxID=1810926 RepID=UPI003CCDF52E